MAKVKFGLLLCSVLGMAVFSAPSLQKKAQPQSLAAYRNNSCVMCHADLTEPLRISSHFFEWLDSKHQRKAVGCEKCHGGDPQSYNVQQAHRGVLRPDFPQSRLHPENQPETCKSCHQEIVNGFVKSEHNLKLQGSGVGPSCTTCHHHMATAVIYWPPQTAALCARCHQDDQNRASQYPLVPNEAADVIAAFTRADEVIEWSQFLLNEGKKRRLSLKAEEAEIKALNERLKDAKLRWHEFDLKLSRQRADEVFTRATKVKDALAKRGL